MVGRMVEAIRSRVETNSFLSEGSPHGLANGNSVQLAGDLVIAIHQTKQLDNQGFKRPAKFVR